MATSPTPSLDSIRGTNSIESYGDHNGYMSDSPLTLSGSSPPVSDSAICDDYSGATSSIESQHQTSSASSSSSSASSTSSTSGLSCGGTVSGLSAAIQSIDEIPDDKENIGVVQCNGILSRNLVSISFPNGSTVPRCTACKSKQSDAVAKCFECANFLCSNCVTAHEFMHCFNGHNVCLIENSSISNNSNINEFKFGNSLSNIFQSQSNRTNSSLSKIINGVFENNTGGGGGLVGGGGGTGSGGISSSSSSSSSSQSHCFNCKDELLTKLSSNNNINSISNRDDVNLLASQLIPSTSMTKSSQYFCNQHKNEILNYFCRTCSALACKDCVANEHSSALHEVEHSQEFLHKQPDCVIQGIVAELRGKVGEVVTVISNSDLIVNQLKAQYQKAHSELNETYQFFYSMLDERKQEIQKELDGLHNAKMLAINSCVNRSKEAVDKALQACDTIERAPVKASSQRCFSFAKKC